MKKKLLFLLVILPIFILNYPGLASPEINLRAPAEVIGITQAVHLRPTLKYGAEIADFNSLVGKDIGFVLYFTDWSQYFENPYNGEVTFIDPYLLTQIEGRFPDPATRPAITITWIPKNAQQQMGGLPACDRDYEGGVPYDVILDGKCDPYLKGVAEAFKEHSEDRILLRFAHEMNIDTSVSHPAHYGLTPGDYAAAWRYIHEIFQNEGVTNVEWVWSPNFRSNPDETWNAIPLYYPGNDYVDWIGLSGYNWYEEFLFGELPWRWFNDIYNEVLTDLTCRYPKPQIIAEVGSVHGDATLSKSSWIFNIYEEAPNYPFLRSISWFNDFAFADASAADFRITSSTAESGDVYPLSDWTSSYSNAISDPIYRERLPNLDTVTPPIAYCGSGEGLFSGPQFRLMQPGTTVPLTLIAMLYSKTLTLSADVPPGFSLVYQPELSPPWDMTTILISISDQTAPGTYQLIFTAGELPPLTITAQVVENLHQNYLSIVYKEP